MIARDPRGPIAVIGLGYVGLPPAMTFRAYRQWGGGAIRPLLRPAGVLFDVKGVLPRDAVDDRL